MWRWLLAVTVALGVGAVWVSGIAAYRRSTGYAAPVFSRDGASVFAVRRSVSAATVGFGYEFWTPPASVFIRRDQFAVVNIRIADGHLTTVAELPPSPLTGERIQAYHGAIFGSASAALGWKGDTLEYEVAITRHDTPLSRTFVARGQWDAISKALREPATWTSGTPSLGGDDEAQLYGRFEVLAVPGEEGLACALVIQHADTRAVQALVQTPPCTAKYPSGITAAHVAPLSRRAAIERTLTIERTYADLVGRGVAAGVNDGEARLQANREMARLGYFPRPTTLTATPATCRADDNVFAISDEEFRVGLFQDIARAIAQPGTDVDKDIGDYVHHQSFDTSRRINEYLSPREHTRFFVQTSTACWQMQITRP